MISDLPVVKPDGVTRAKDVPIAIDPIQLQSIEISARIRENWDRGVCTFYSPYLFPENGKLLKEKGYDVKLDVNLSYPSVPPQFKYHVQWPTC